MNPELLSISFVTYQLDLPLFEQVLKHLQVALRHLATQRAATARITIVDNGNDAGRLREVLERSGLAAHSDVVEAGSNLGYGRAHNLAIMQARATYHLVMNPDVLVAEDALSVALAFLDAHPEVAAISPHAVDGAGAPAFLCKRYPAVLDLALRGFAPRALRRWFAKRLDRYENQEVVTRQQPAEVDLISGCFMFCRADALRQAGGFNPAFFLYFEDFSLSLELQKQGRLMYLPTCHIAHYGGHASRKGPRHLLHFTASALKFYNHYGWKLL